MNYFIHKVNKNKYISFEKKKIDESLSSLFVRIPQNVYILEIKTIIHV